MIQAQNLTKRFGRFTAVDDVSFAVKKGEVLGFLGPNGAGKSTSMRMLTGFLDPDLGQVRIGEHVMADNPIAAKSHIGYLPENAPLYGDMTVEGFLSFIAALRDLSGKKRLAAIDRVVELCDLGRVRYQSIDTLSKGYRHRTCFAQALIHDPAVLVLDEPTDGLDPNQKHEMRTLIKRMGETKAIILSTHILEEVDAVCSRVIIINRGKLVSDGLPSELRARSELHGAVTLRLLGVSETEVSYKLRKVEGVARMELLEPPVLDIAMRFWAADGEAAGGLAGRLAALCVAEGWRIGELHTEEGRLDEVFRSITTSENAGEDTDGDGDGSDETDADESDAPATAAKKTEDSQ